MELKTCRLCGVEKPLSDFARNPKRKDGTNRECKDCKNEYNKGWYKLNSEKHKGRVSVNNRKIKVEIRSFLEEAKDVPCKDCGKKYPHYVMDFDHLPEFNKSFSLGRAASQKVSIELLKSEISKCEIVCANCHRERTHNRSASRAGCPVRSSKPNVPGSTPG